MHECPQCWSICYCDLDDSNDCRENGVCYHECEPDPEDMDADAHEVFDDEPAVTAPGEERRG